MQNELNRHPGRPEAMASGYPPACPIISKIDSASCSAIADAIRAGQWGYLSKTVAVESALSIHSVQHSALTLSRPFPETFIKIVVGLSEQKFYINKALLCSKSGYLKEECKKYTSKITIAHQDASVFQYFVYWLYTGRLLGYHNNGLSQKSVHTIQVIRILADNISTGKEAAQNFKDPREARKEEGEALMLCYPLEQLVALYVFAEELRVYDLKKKIVHAIATIYGQSLGPSINASTAYWTYDWGSTGKTGPIAAVNLAYEKLPGKSVLKRLLVLLYVKSVRLDCKEIRMQFNTEFLCDVLAEFRGKAYGAKSGPRMGDFWRGEEEILKMFPIWGQEVDEGTKPDSVDDGSQVVPLQPRQWFFHVTPGY